jgi:hypothetical protein
VEGLVGTHELALGLDVVRVRTGDGRTGTAVYEVTGARHHRFFPDTDVAGILPC